MRRIIHLPYFFIYLHKIYENMDYNAKLGYYERQQTRLEYLSNNYQLLTLKQFTIDLYEEIYDLLQTIVENLEDNKPFDCEREMAAMAYKIDNLLEIVDTSLKDYEFLKKMLDIIE